MKRTNLLLVFFLSFIFLVAQERTIKVSSFNVRNDNTSDAENGNGWVNRYPVIANMILFHDLDIVGTQECKNNQITDLLSVLSKFNYSYIGRGRGTNPTDDEYSAIFYKTDKYELLNSGNFWLSETPDIPSKGWDAALNRICTWGEFEDKSTQFTFFAFNLHMDHIGVDARKYSSELVIEKIKEIANGQPVFLTGDFNTDQYAEGYQIITTSCLLKDSYVSAPIVHDLNGTFNSFDINNTTNQRIDHVFISDQFTPLRYGILTDIYWTDADGEPSHPRDFPAETTVITGTPRLPSDHYPVVVELKF
ncbi:MAG: endonuclease/exonuclease/phosphatase family protein [Paludibacter sp.]|nr:endonuclease/exonuclease/phosphatase family protein [Paludibacter sp.]